MLYTLAATWTVRGRFGIEAESLEEAKQQLMTLDLAPVMTDPVDNTFEIDELATGDGSPHP